MFLLFIYYFQLQTSKIKEYYKDATLKIEKLLIIKSCVSLHNIISKNFKFGESEKFSVS